MKMQGAQCLAIAIVLVLLLSHLSLWTTGFAQARLDIMWKQDDHHTPIFSMAFSPDGQYLVLGGWRGTFLLWRASDGALVRTFRGKRDNLRSLTFSPDSQYIASAGGNTIQLWRVSDGSLVNTLEGNNQSFFYSVDTVLFSPDGQYLISVERNNTIRIWRVSNGTLVHTFAERTDEAEKVFSAHKAVALSPDGKHLALGETEIRFDCIPHLQKVRKEKIRLVRITDGALVRTFDGHAGGVLSVAFAPDSQYLASAGVDNTIKIWCVSDGALVHTLKDKHDVISLTFSPNGHYLISGNVYGTVRLWRVSDGALVQTYDLETRTGVRSIQFSPDGRSFVYAPQSGMVLMARNPFQPASDVNGDGVVDD